ncbi:MAG: UvrD-helicase domain-containing protein, partial [Burkholderiaceae bacterium]|nr:UvrD-helicase domain-containing protein [Burkholderiaceae bacterium]
MSADNCAVTAAPQPFDPLQFPLRGRGLIEASAGTGKTWTIALLYLRLALGHGQTETAFARALAPAEILVMTFTEAATQELRERIRQRLAQAARAFAGEAPPDDDALARLLAAYPRADWPARAAQLRLAAQNMDDAAVLTIHGWAGRALREHALASGSPFDEKIAPDDGSDVQRQALLDHWRRAFYPLDAAAAGVVWQCFPGPDALWRAVHPLLRLGGEEPLLYRGETLTDETDSLQDLEHLGQDWSRIEELQNAARRLWREDREAIEAIWRTARPDLNGRNYRQKDDDAVFAAWLGALTDWSHGAAAPDNIALFSQSGGKLKKDKTPPRHAAFAALDAWLAAQADMADGLDALKARLVAQAARAVRKETARIRAQRAELGFDDLLTRLDAALAGPGGTQLAARIRAQFPVALVDEFQDTDPLQYRILQRIYGDAGTAAGDCALILIGDPKQAIYAFRGADIHTYLAAREDALAAPGIPDTPDGHAAARASLATNYRSTGELVAAVNHVFARAAHRAQGAFGFKQGDDDRVPFAPVQAQGRAERLWIDGQPATALTLWSLSPEEDSSCVGLAAYRARMARVFAAQVAHWLIHTAQDDPHRCGFVDARQPWQPLQPKDIAVLVRSGAEAGLIRAALQAHGVPSVYLSERASVFDTVEARDVA